ncbi:DUF4407 domain-containing protein [Nocardia bovistercoris]|uniref:DUF4407 domain-containing protein n=1 Tax=Nocardia bovistercoris TaxID=2785916 RepID=A0A931IE12_9NOCA|nr:DUF4407 domain-containing protein [Nocardia bovistercoris]MBH0779471.1 DUF4407 domain-containing protein [Nocardia bovistercoris]
MDSANARRNGRQDNRIRVEKDSASLDSAAASDTEDRAEDTGAPTTPGRRAGSSGGSTHDGAGGHGTARAARRADAEAGGAPIDRIGRTRPGTTRPENARRDGSDGARAPSRVERAMIWVSGYDPALLATAVERYRAVCAGVLVLLVSALAAFGVTVLLWTVVGGFRFWFLAAGAGWATVVFWVDRSILVEPHYGNLRDTDAEADRRSEQSTAELRTPWPPHESEADEKRTRRGRMPRPSGAGASRIVVYAARVLLAVAVAFLVGEALVLAVLHPEVMSVWRATAEQDYRSELLELGPKRVPGLQRQLAGVNDTLAAKTTARDTAKTERDRAYAIYNEELNGTGGTGVPGRGREEGDAQAKYTHAEAQLTAAQQELDRATPILRGQAAGLEQQIKDLSGGAIDSDAMKAVADDDAGRAAWERTHARPGWVEQEKALETYLSRQDSWFVLAVPWVLRVLLLSVDLLPLSLKLLTPHTVIGARIRDQALAVRYDDRRLLRSRLRHLDRSAALRDHDEGLAARLRYDTQSFYFHNRTDHLNPRRPRDGQQPT